MVGFSRRRQANVMGGRTCHHRVTVSVDEEAKLAALASSLGVTIPRLLVESALASDRPGGTGLNPEQRAIAQDLLGLNTLLQAVGRNVNQLARVANSTGEVSSIGDELTATLAAVRRTIVRVDELSVAVLQA